MYRVIKKRAIVGSCVENRYFVQVRSWFFIWIYDSVNYRHGKCIGYESSDDALGAVDRLKIARTVKNNEFIEIWREISKK